MSIFSSIISKVPKILLVSAMCIFILAIFTLGLVVYNESASMNNSKMMRTKLKIASLVSLINEFKKDNGRYPKELAELSNSGSKGLPLDNRSSPFLYQYNEKNSSYRVYTLGKDRKIGGVGLDGDYDNFTNWALVY
ncbi:MAG: type II secretion system protein GspG [Colwellia sp.]|nr:type II secretion system protein GspG [Colwellia sp.]